MAANLNGFLYYECDDIKESLLKILERICLQNEKLVVVTNDSYADLIGCLVEYSDATSIIDRDELDQLYQKIIQVGDKTVTPGELLINRI